MECAGAFVCESNVLVGWKESGRVRGEEKRRGEERRGAVSYTHLTLPTTSRV